MTTRKTYDLPAPVRTRDTISTWHTGHSIEIDGNFNNNGVIVHNCNRKLIFMDTYDGEELAFDYDEAQRVALALLAAVEEAEANQNNN